MKNCLPVIFFILKAAFLTGCVQRAAIDGVSPNSDTLRLRFQNMVALELTPAGCQMLDHGGLDRYCQVMGSDPVDFSFEVGPAFSKIWTLATPPPPDQLRALRGALWQAWEKLQVKLYAVDARDLVPSISDFDRITQGTTITRLSTNLKSADGKRLLFAPFFSYDDGAVHAVFLSFSPPEKVKETGEWRTADPVSALSEVLPQLPANTTHLFVLGSLPQPLRAALAQAARRPLIFVGGDFPEYNTIELVQETPHAAFMKSPHLGRGYGDISISRSTLVTSFRPTILRKMAITNASCQHLIPESAIEFADQGSPAANRQIAAATGVASPCAKP